MNLYLLNLFGLKKMLVSPSSANLEIYTCTHIHRCIYLNAEAVQETANKSLRMKCRLLAGV